MLNMVHIETPHGDALVDITDRIKRIVSGSAVQDGLCALIVPHTTAAITVNSALDAATAADILADIKRLVPTRLDFAHQYDTPADAAGHIKAALVGHSVMLVIREGRLLLGGSQSILLYEFDGRRRRRIQVKIIAG